MLQINLPSSLDLPTVVPDLPTVISDLPTVVPDLPTIVTTLSRPVITRDKASPIRNVKSKAIDHRIQL